MSSSRRQVGLGGGYFIDLKRKNTVFGTVIVDGKRRRVTTGIVCKDPLQFAEREKAKFLAERKMHGIRKVELKKKAIIPRPLFCPTWDKWVETKSQEWAKGTTADVHCKGRWLKEYYYNDCVDEVEEKWEGFIQWMSPKQLKLAKHQDYLSSFLKYCHRKNVIPTVPFLRNPDPPVDVGKYINDKVWATMWKAAKGDLKVQIGMMYFMGMRSGEVLLLNKARINWHDRAIKLLPEDTKTRRGREIPVHPDVFPLLKKKCSQDKSEFVFPSARHANKSQTKEGNKRAWATLLRKLDIRFRRHDLRHTCATNFARKGVSPALACRVLGMSLEVYDKIYCRPNLSDLRKVFDT